MAGQLVSATTVYVSRDAAALSVGADAVAKAILAQAREHGLDINLARVGSRGLLWLEPLVEVATDAGRIAYGPVATSDVPGLLAANFTQGGAHALRLGATADIPYFKSQQRLTFARVGLADPVSIADYLALGGFRGLTRALAMPPAEIIRSVTDSGLRGRGGGVLPKIYCVQRR
jgi:formate dehydrogenase iron-sulfur subunit